MLQLVDMCVRDYVVDKLTYHNHNHNVHLLASESSSSSSSSCKHE